MTITILANVNTDTVKKRMEDLARAGGYHLEEWLVPAINGAGLIVSATRMFGREKHGLGFRWSGEDINELARRCMALDLSMNMLPDAVKQGRGARWPTQQ